MNLMFALVLLAPTYHEGDMEQQRLMLYMQRVCVTAEEFKIRKPESFTMDANKPAQTMSPREALSLPYWTAF